MWSDMQFISFVKLMCYQGIMTLPFQGMTFDVLLSESRVKSTPLKNSIKETLNLAKRRVRAFEKKVKVDLRRFF